MAGTLFQDNLSPYLTVVEQGSTPATPSAGNQKLFVRTSDHVLCYLNSSGTVTPFGGSTTPVANRVSRTAGDITTTSTTFVDMTGMSITLTTLARRCIVGFIGTGYHSANNGGLYITVDIDGTNVAGSTNSLQISYTVSGGQDIHPIGLSYLTDVLSAASHTFKVQWKVASGTGTIYAQTALPITMWVSEQGATA